MLLKNGFTILPAVLIFISALSEFEQGLLRRKGMENDPLIIEALNIFKGRIVS
jgi:hypothetical protein